MAKAPTYNKAAVDKQLTKNGVVKPKVKANTHKLLKGHQKTDESRVDEISSDMASRYKKNAKMDREFNDDDLDRAVRKSRYGSDDDAKAASADMTRLQRRNSKRTAGINRANKRIGEEDLAEISKDTARRYRNKAGDDLKHLPRSAQDYDSAADREERRGRSSYDTRYQGGPSLQSDDDRDDADTNATRLRAKARGAERKMSNRAKGISRASKRIYDSKDENLAEYKPGVTVLTRSISFNDFEGFKGDEDYATVKKIRWPYGIDVKFNDRNQEVTFKTAKMKTVAKILDKHIDFDSNSAADILDLPGALLASKNMGEGSFYGQDKMVAKMKSDEKKKGLVTMRKTDSKSTSGVTVPRNMVDEYKAKGYKVVESAEKSTTMDTFKVTYQTTKGTTTVKIKARDKNEAKAKARKRSNFKGNATASLVESNQINEGVLDDMDDDGFMAKRQLYDLAKYSVELHRMIQDTDNLEPWIQAKITKAADYIDTVKHYMEYQGVRDGEDMAGEVGMDDIADVDATLDTMGPEAPMEEVMEFEDEGERLDGYDVLRMAATRRIISKDQFDNPSPEIEEIAHWVADRHFSDAFEIGSSDISIAMKDFCGDMEANGQYCGGDNAHLYESANKAQAIYKRMIGGLKGKK